MSFPRDAYPYTNFHELNLGYFIVHFREIFSQWADLYDQMLNWKDATDEELATWKAGVEADLDQRAAALRAELETWKAQTGQDIAGWEDATLAALTAWQTATQAVFEAIRVEAAGSATAAAASAGDAATAKTAAETAQAAAEAAAASVQASAAQITTNTEDISDLKTQLILLTEAIPNGGTELTFDWEAGGITSQGANDNTRPLSIRTNYLSNIDGKILHFTKENATLGRTSFVRICKYNTDGTPITPTVSLRYNQMPSDVQLESGYLYRFSLNSYDTSGDAVQTSANDVGISWKYELNYVPPIIKNEIDTIQIKKENTTFWAHETSANVLDISNPIYNHYFRPVDGSLVEYNGISSFYVPIDGAVTYATISATSIYGTAQGAKICLFDDAKTYIKTITGTLGSAVSDAETIITFSIMQSDIDEGASYFGISILNGSINTAMVIKNSSTYPDEYVPYVNLWALPDLTLNSEQIQKAMPTNVLYRKTAIYDGDSICHATNDPLDGWAGRIAANNEMTYHNLSISGATLTSGIYHDNTGTPRHWISSYIDTLYANYPNADYIIFEGGTNDADLIGSILDPQNIPAAFGSWSETDFTGNYNDETFCGAVETIIYKAVNYWPKKKIGFIIAMKMGFSNGTGSRNRHAYFNTIIEICKKWGMPYVNLWEDCPMNPSIESCYDRTMTVEENIAAGKLYKDGQHPTPDGYNRISPIIEAWMRTL